MFVTALSYNANFDSFIRSTSHPKVLIMQPNFDFSFENPTTTRCNNFGSYQNSSPNFHLRTDYRINYNSCAYDGATSGGTSSPANITEISEVYQNCPTLRNYLDFFHQTNKFSTYSINNNDNNNNVNEQCGISHNKEMFSGHQLEVKNKYGSNSELSCRISSPDWELLATGNAESEIFNSVQNFQNQTSDKCFWQRGSLECKFDGSQCSKPKGMYG